MRWIDKARDVAKEYKSNCAELKRLREREADMPGSLRLPVMGGAIHKPVEEAVERMISQERGRYLEQAVAAVDFALECVLQKPQGAVTVELFNMVYYNKSHTLYGAAMALNTTERTAKRYNRYLLKMAALGMGFIGKN